MTKLSKTSTESCKEISDIGEKPNKCDKFGINLLAILYG